MKTFALIIDYSLYALVALTIALIVYKVIDLYRPPLLGKPALDERDFSSQVAVNLTLESLESGMALLAVIAATAPFVGLVGTVMHIIEALRGMSAAGVDISIISGPIATALTATLVGLASAIPAAAAHSLLLRRLQVLENNYRAAVA